jgi:REP element-mobilizing transposase RayT
VSPDHIPLFCSFPPRDSLAQVVTRCKSVSARAICREFPRVKRRLWGGELWEDGYCARTVGDKVTAEVIRRTSNNIALRRQETLNGPCLNRFCP